MYIIDNTDNTRIRTYYKSYLLKKKERICCLFNFWGIYERKRYSRTDSYL